METFYPLFVLLCLFSYSSNAATDPFLRCLSSRKIQTKVLEQIIKTPDTANYTSELKNYIRNSRFNTSRTYKPTIIMSPYEESQVQAAVTCAKNVGLLLKIRSGGHDYEGLSYTSNVDAPFAVLDMNNFTSIDIDMAEETAWVQSGATLGELYYRIWEKSKIHAFPAGVCSTLGVGGHLAGGGYGNMLRKFGLSVDNLLDAKIVDAKGRILDRKEMGEDLFWAIKGGGGSFGLILSYKIKLVQVPPTVTVFKVSRTLEENAIDLVYRWQYFADKVDDDLFLRARIQASTDSKIKGQRTIESSFIAMFLGDSNRLLSIMKDKFPELGLTKQDCKEMSWIKSVLFWAEFPEGTPETALLGRKELHVSAFKIKSDYVKTPIPKDGLQGAFKKMAESSGDIVRMLFNPYGGRMSEILETETAFPHRRGNVYKIQYIVFWQESGPEAEKRHIDEMRELHSYMTPYVSSNPREAFLNYRDIDVGSTDNGKDAYDRGKIYGVKYFKGNFDRLTKIKTMVDPDNFFRNEQSIPPLKKN
ncbi:berberine bridge enzyme-like 8 [Primulina huaijiensis]|uniref:berberine bridge enzyme-like 8 n=1 Tax=Primulina huaijiensis TaxID=1492673 RepID=UPI003CC737EB